MKQTKKINIREKVNRLLLLLIKISDFICFQFHDGFFCQMQCKHIYIYIYTQNKYCKQQQEQLHEFKINMLHGSMKTWSM